MTANLPIDFKNAEQLVAKVLKEYPEARSNDRELIRLVWELQGFRIPRKLLPFYYRVLSPESIRRTRQKLQAQGLFLPEAEKVAKRSLFAMEMRNYFRRENERNN